jgi:hypothetical protein
MTSLQNSSARYFSASRLRGICRMTRRMKLPVPTNGSRMATPGDGQPVGLAELAPQDVVHRAHHEIDDGLRRVDDAVGIGHLDAEALEELLIDGVEESSASRDSR